MSLGPEPDLPQAVAAAVLAHPAVVRLDGGPFGSIASYLPGRRVVGVRVGVGDGPVEVAVVVLRPWPAGLPAVAEEIAAAVRGVVGERAVDVTVADVVAAPTPHPLPRA
ncbi:hypothetical protein GCM10009836_28180 [Pseudonocardia ailaonensis]|uniref:Asp23/Gls24 family envelope stress response protein n=1 Tax=Pseudonocardia ailaonensis TaxID=367279 RepID=A0ABN2N1F3_9PSEU